MIVLATLWFGAVFKNALLMVCSSCIFGAQGFHWCVVFGDICAMVSGRGCGVVGMRGYQVWLSALN